MKLYRVEIIEKDVIKDMPIGLRDVERVSIPAQTLKEAIEKARKLAIDFEDFLQSEKYYIKIYYYTIEKEERK